MSIRLELHAEEADVELVRLQAATADMCLTDAESAADAPPTDLHCCTMIAALLPLPSLLLPLLLHMLLMCCTAGSPC
jgi:hypothetical protein